MQKKLDMIEGERIAIRPATPAALRDLIRLWNDGRVMRWVGFPEGLGYTAEDVASWYHALQKRPNRQHFVVHSAETGFCGEVYYTAAFCLCYYSTHLSQILMPKK
jgi:RimJ/RimL family protein N-acetyltransferase